MAATTTTVKSSKGTAEYTLFLSNGKALGCSCPARTYSPGKACKHMNAHNVVIQTLAQAAAYEQEAAARASYVALFNPCGV